MSDNNFIFLFVFSILVLTSLLVAFIYRSRRKSELIQLTQEKELLKLQFDQIRKEKIELEDKIQQVQAQERTYQVAYEDWKSKYTLLEDRYIQLKKESEILQQSLSTISVEAKKNAELVQQPTQHPSILDKEITKSPLDAEKILSDLKAILDQHLHIISGMISEDDFSKLGKNSIPSDPLHWIQGMDKHVVDELEKQGIRSFKQLAATPKKELKKWMITFEEVDEKLIESWPLQASAILASKA